MLNAVKGKVIQRSWGIQTIFSNSFIILGKGIKVNGTKIVKRETNSPR